MEYHEAVDRLERLRRLRPELGTESTASLLTHLGDPHEELPAVQIAGSNGKGSTASVLERILREGGLEVGLYTSPDLNDLRERVSVCGRPIPKREVVRFVETAWPYVVERAVEGRAPTFFEVLTALALWHFDREGVDVAVLEVGIGGRYDATSVVDPVAAAVTAVSLEHTDILGSTVEEIARDKAQVAPEAAPLVTGATGTALEAIREEADVVTVGIADDPGAPSDEQGTLEDASGQLGVGLENTSGQSRNGLEETSGQSGTVPNDPSDRPESEPDVTVRECEVVSAAESTISLVGPDWEVHTRTPLPGAHQAVNAGIAATLARQIADASEAEIAAGIGNVRWPGRFEVMDDAPLTILDGAHNPAACETLASLVSRLEYDECHLVFGAMRDKDHREMARTLPELDRVYLAEPAVDRAQDAETLAATFERESDAELTTCDSVLAALGRALTRADDADCVLVTGSLSVVGEARDWWTQTPRVVRTDTTARARSVMRRADVPASIRRAHADRFVSRTVRFHARRDGARDLQRLALSLGATCVVSGVDATDRHVQVALSGTLEQFTELVRELRGRSIDAGPLVERLHVLLGTGDGTNESSQDYPWMDGTAVMGILNVTPDSFHDGGEYDAVDDAVARAEELVAQGAAVVDVGGESTRPGGEPVSAEVERDRVVPVVERLAGLEAMVSVDTRKPTVAEAALEAGADMVNDVSGLANAELRRVVAEYDVPVVLMHSLDAPVDPGRRVVYDDVVDDVLATLTERVLLAERAGISRANLVVDPGLGFGKAAAESFELLDRLEEFRALGTPIMVGHSHKSMFEGVAPDSDDRFAPTVAATALAVQRGVDLVRVHDVAANVAAVATAERTRGDG